MKEWTIKIIFKILPLVYRYDGEIFPYEGPRFFCCKLKNHWIGFNRLRLYFFFDKNQDERETNE